MQKKKLVILLLAISVPAALAAARSLSPSRCQKTENALRQLLAETGRSDPDPRRVEAFCGILRRRASEEGVPVEDVRGSIWEQVYPRTRNHSVFLWTLKDVPSFAKRRGTLRAFVIPLSKERRHVELSFQVSSFRCLPRRFFTAQCESGEGGLVRDNAVLYADEDHCVLENSWIFDEQQPRAKCVCRRIRNT